MGFVRIEFHHDGFNELRKSYQDEIDSFGESAAASANAMASLGDSDEARGGQRKAREEPFAYQSKPNATRARGIVKTATYYGRLVQARDDVLTRAVLGG